jgi:alpha-methylacyl-CoA racemase
VARETFVDIDGITQPAPAPRFSRTRPATPTSPSLPGDHTRALLGELGLDADTIAELLDTGVVVQSGSQ